MDGRKSVGGKLEIKLRVANPFLTKQVEQVEEKWLVIDAIERKVQAPGPPARYCLQIRFIFGWI